MKHAVALMVWTSALAAQNISTIQIVAPKNRLISGESIQLVLSLRDREGFPTSEPVLWASDNSAVAAVSSTGLVTTGKLGLARISATVSFLRTQTMLQVLPKSISIRPAIAELNVNGTQQFEAVAFDVKGSPIAGTPFIWNVTSGQGFRTNAAAIDSKGLLSAFAEGSLLVTGSFDYAGAIPSLERTAQATAAVRIRTKSAFELAKLASNSEWTNSFVLRPKTGQLLGTDSGHLLFNASLSGVANGLLMLDSGTPKLVAPAGIPGPVTATFISDYQSPSINNNGEFVAIAWAHNSANLVVRGDSTGSKPWLIDQATVARMEGLTGFGLSRNSLADSGYGIFRASYRAPGTTVTRTGLFRMFTPANGELLISDGDPLPDLPGAPALDANEFGIASDGAAFFAASAGPLRAIYRKTLDGVLSKVMGTGDALEGSTVRSFLSHDPRYFYVSQSGDLIFGVTLNDNSIWTVRYLAGGAGQAPQTLRMRGTNGVFWSNPASGTLLWGDTGQGGGLSLWKMDGTVQQLIALRRTAVDGQTINQIDGATLRSSGEVVAIVRTDANPYQIVRLGATPEVILKAGAAIPVAAPVNIIALAPSGRLGPAQVLAGGRGGSVLQTDGGRLAPTLLLGEVVSAYFYFTGANPWDTRQDADGNLYITATSGQGAYRVTSEGLQQVVKGSQPQSDGTIVFSPYAINVNQRRDALWQSGTSRGDTRVYLTREGESKLVLTNGVDSATRTLLGPLGMATGWNELALDDEGRVMTTIRFDSGAVATCLWQDGSWIPVLVQGQTVVDQWRVNVVRDVKAQNGVFYARLEIQGGTSALGVYEQGAWKIVVSVSDFMPNGQSVNSVILYDVNRNGDILFQASGFGQWSLQLKRRSDFYHLFTNSQPTDSGDILARVMDLNLKDDGTVYFLAMSVFDENLLYRAKALF